MAFWVVSINRTPKFIELRKVCKMTSQIALTEEIERKNKMSRLIDIDRTKVSRKFQGLSGRKID